MIFNDWKKDLPASFVVFLVALPLCLGIALASGAPLYAGIITGIVGGIVVGSLSGSHLSVSGPAAGLTVVVFQSIQNLGGYSCFLLALVFAGVLQIFLGILKAGSLSAFFPFSVIKGMLAAIGIILILNQIPVILGIQEWTLPESWDRFNWVSIFLGSSSILFLFLWDRWNQKFLKLIPASLAVIVWAFGIEILLEIFQPDWKLQPSQRVQIPIIGELQQFFLHIDRPDFSEWKNLAVYKVAIAICLIASLETLLSVEAMDKLDPEKRITPTNRELVAQGFGNLLCGLLSGIPLTAVIVRSTVNLNSGAKTRLSCILHGIWLLFAFFFFAEFFNHIPLASLAAILIHVGYKLASPTLFIEYLKKSQGQYIPFFLTILAILLTDLLTGILIGILVSFAFVIRENYRESIHVSFRNGAYRISFEKDLFFLNKPELRRKIESIPNGSKVVIDGHRARFIDADVLESLEDFLSSAKERNLKIQILKSEKSSYPLFRNSLTVDSDSKQYRTIRK